MPMTPPKIYPTPKQTEFSGRIVEISVEPDVHFISGLDDEEYIINVDSNGARITVSTEKALFWAKLTLDQLRVGSSNDYYEVKIKDKPAISTRGIMLDVSRCKVPTVDFLRELIDKFSLLKFNHLELYFEHTYMYENHPEVWKDASPFSKDEILHLIKYSKMKNIELSLNQNTFGHMERWLIFPRYRDLAIVKGLALSPYGLYRPPTTLDPAKNGSVELIEELLNEVTPLFESNRVNIGFDEPFELPYDRINEWGDYLLKLTNLDVLKEKEVLIWGDVLSSHPSLMEKIPPNVTVVEWGYEANSPLYENTLKLKENGINSWVAAGTSSWLSLLGRSDNAFANIRNAVEATTKNSLQGYLLTDWGDFGNLQFWPISWPSVVLSSQLSWTGITDESKFTESDVVEAAASTVFTSQKEDRKFIEGLIELGRATTDLKCQFPNLVTLILHMYFPQLPVGSGLTTGLLESDLENVISHLERGKSLISASYNTNVKDEVLVSCELMQIVVEDARLRLSAGGFLKDVTESDRLSLSKSLNKIISTYNEIWDTSSRPGGKDESLSWLRHLEECYRIGDPDLSWSGPLKLID